MRKRAIITIAVCCVLGLGLTACQGASGEDQPKQKDSPTLTAKDMDYTQQIDNLKKRAETYAPEVITNAAGTKIQLVPDSETSYLLGNEAGYDHNVYYINGNNRGCESCHTTGLMDLINNGVVGHVKVSTPLATDLQINDCIQCHTKYGLNDADLFHGIHLGHFDGDCNSCHVVKDGWETLWRDNKFDVLKGYKDLDDKKLEDAEFTYDQTTMSDAQMSVDWTFDKFEIDMYNNAYTNQPLDDKTYNDWEISFSGAVNQESTVKLTDLISEAESAGAVKEFDMTLANSDVYPTSGLIGQNHYKGIDFNWIMQKAGVRGDCAGVTPVLPDGSNVSNTIDRELLNQNIGSYLVYEINGDKLSWKDGYPCAFISSIYESSGSGKWCGGFKFETTDSILADPYIHMVSNSATYDSIKAAKPAGSDGKFPSFVGCANLVDGQIVDAKDAFTLEGYAYAPAAKVTSVELSFDKGKSWKKLDVTNCENGKWVYWKFKKTYEPGSYEIMARATFDNGIMTDMKSPMTLTVQGDKSSDQKSS